MESFAAMPLWAVTGGLPPEWAGLTPLRDWDMARAVVSGADITSVPNDPRLSAAALTGVGSNEPQYVSSSSHFNNTPAASFTAATTERLTFGDLGASSGGPATVVVVAKVLSDFANNQYVLSFTNDDLSIYGKDSSGFWVAWQSADFTEIASDNVHTTAAVIFCTLSGGTQRLYVNSTTEEPGGPAASTGCDYSGGGVIGNYQSPSTANGLRGELARVLVFDSLLDATQRGVVMNALGAKYGITIS